MSEVKSPDHRSRLPLTVVNLAGSQGEMGAQQGEILGELGGWEAMAEFYPRMATRTMAMRVPHGARALVEPILQTVISASARRLAGRRWTHFPEYAARSRQLLRSSPLPMSLSRWFVAMDVMQNCIANIAMRDKWALTGMKATALAACSSLSVWGEASSDGVLRHARNFDFPGAGIWDEAPVVVFCTPNAGVRYGFVTTRGADAPGVTAFNEAGITLTAHTRFHRCVSPDAAAVIDIGHHIVQHADSLEAAVRLAREVRSSSSWGFLVSSGFEKDAVVIECHADGMQTVRPAVGDSHLGCTNRYETSLRAGEIIPSPAFCRDSDARYERLQAAVRGGPLGRVELEALLGSVASSSQLVSGHRPLAGDCIASPITVQSVVLEPTLQQVRVSVGTAPTGLGPYVTIPWTWSDTPSARIVAHEPRAVSSTAVAAHEREAMGLYSRAVGRQTFGAHPDEVLALLEDAVDHVPHEPHFRYLAAGFAAVGGHLDTAQVHAEAAFESERGPRRREIGFLAERIKRSKHLRAERKALAASPPDLLLVDV
jgi:hypothetical protein